MANRNKPQEPMESVLTKAMEIQEKSIQDLAQEYVPKAMKTLGKFSKGQSVNGKVPSASTVRQSAKDVIEFAGGRPETRAPGSVEDKGLIINILQFGTGQPVRHAIEAVESIELTPGDATLNDVAKRLSDAMPTQVSKTYEVE